MDAPKIVFPDIAKGPRFALDVDGHYGSNTIYFIPLEDHYLLGLLNSSLSHFYFQSVCAGLEGGGEVYLRFFGQYMEGFPVPRADDTDQQGAKARETLAQMAKAREQLEARLATARTPLDAENHRREAARIDDQIDRLVYDLYDLTDLEVALVEGSVLPA